MWRIEMAILGEDSPGGPASGTRASLGGSRGSGSAGSVVRLPICGHMGLSLSSGAGLVRTWVAQSREAGGVRAGEYRDALRMVVGADLVAETEDCGFPKAGGGECTNKAQVLGRCAHHTGRGAHREPPGRTMFSKFHLATWGGSTLVCVGCDTIFGEGDEEGEAYAVMDSGGDVCCRPCLSGFVTAMRGGSARGAVEVQGGEIVDYLFSAERAEAEVLDRDVWVITERVLTFLQPSLSGRWVERADEAAQRAGEDPEAMPLMPGLEALASGRFLVVLPTAGGCRQRRALDPSGGHYGATIEAWRGAGAVVVCAFPVPRGEGRRVREANMLADLRAQRERLGEGDGDEEEDPESDGEEVAGAAPSGRTPRGAGAGGGGPSPAASPRPGLGRVVRVVGSARGGGGTGPLGGRPPPTRGGAARAVTESEGDSGEEDDAGYEDESDSGGGGSEGSPASTVSEDVRRGGGNGRAALLAAARLRVSGAARSVPPTPVLTAARRDEAAMQAEILADDAEAVRDGVGYGTPRASAREPYHGTKQGLQSAAAKKRATQQFTTAGAGDNRNSLQDRPGGERGITVDAAGKMVLSEAETGADPQLAELKRWYRASLLRLHTVITRGDLGESAVREAKVIATRYLFLLSALGLHNGQSTEGSLVTMLGAVAADLQRYSLTGNGRTTHTVDDALFPVVEEYRAAVGAGFAYHQCDSEWFEGQFQSRVEHYLQYGGGQAFTVRLVPRGGLPHVGVGGSKKNKGKPTGGAQEQSDQLALDSMSHEERLALGRGGRGTRDPAEDALLCTLLRKKGFQVENTGRSMGCEIKFTDSAQPVWVPGKMLKFWVQPKAGGRDGGAGLNQADMVKGTMAEANAIFLQADPSWKITALKAKA